MRVVDFGREASGGDRDQFESIYDHTIINKLDNGHPLSFIKMQDSENHLLTWDSTSTVKLWDLRDSSWVNIFKDTMVS